MTLGEWCRRLGKLSLSHPVPSTGRREGESLSVPALRSASPPRVKPGAAYSPIWGGMLGTVLLGWSVLMVLAPELASVVGVFGSPFLALFVIVRLLSGRDLAANALRGPTLTELGKDPALLERVRAQSGGVCAGCGADNPSTLRAVLPVGRSSIGIEHRFVALCAACSTGRTLRR
jgi:hypothetical protein